MLRVHTTPHTPMVFKHLALFADSKIVDADANNGFYNSFEADDIDRFYSYFGKEGSKAAAYLIERYLANSMDEAGSWYSDEIKLLQTATFAVTDDTWQKATDARGALENLLGKPEITAAASVVTNSLTDDKKLAAACGEAMPCVLAGKSLMTLMDLLQVETFSPKNLLKEGAEPWPIDTMCAAIQLFEKVICVLVLSCYIVDIVAKDMYVEEVKGPQQKSATTLQVSVMLQDAISMVVDFTKDFKIEADMFAEMGQASDAAVSVNDATRTMTHFYKTWLPLVKQDIFKLLYNRLNIEVATLAKCTPTWNHIVSPQKYSAVLAKRQLLETDSSANLSGAIDKVFSLVESISKIHGVWGMPNKVEEVAEVISAEARLDLGRSTSSVIAAVNVLENFKGAPNQATMAATVISEGIDLPEILVSKLKAIT